MLVEAEIMRYLADYGFSAYVEVPPERPPEFVTVQRVGGGVAEYPLEAPIVAVQCWAPSLARAAEMADELVVLMLSLPDEFAWVADCEMNSRYPYPDQERRAERYQTVYDVLCYL